MNNSDLTLHHLNNSRSHRVLWLMEELELPYQIKFYQRDPATMLAPASLKAIHPLGKSPILTDGVRTLAESAVILEYLLEKYGNNQLKPPVGSADLERFKYWMHYAEGSLMPVLLLNLIFNRMPTQPMPFFMRPIVSRIAAKVKKAFVTPQSQLHLGFIESELNKSTWFTGDHFTAADIHMSYPLEAASGRIENFSAKYPKMADFLARIKQRAAYQRAHKKSGE